MCHWKERSTLEESSNLPTPLDEFPHYDASYRIQILEKRLKRHEEQALHKYYELDHKLRTDPRLASLLQAQ